MKVEWVETNCWNCCWFEPDKKKESKGECRRKICQESREFLTMNCDSWCYYFRGVD